VEVAACLVLVLGLASNCSPDPQVFYSHFTYAHFTRACPTASLFSSQEQQWVSARLGPPRAPGLEEQRPVGWPPPLAPTFPRVIAPRRRCHARFAGKVHGSLARAGKVRGQTPKVPKQDKKKKPKGRAMKRIKYNRRFVNVGGCMGRGRWGRGAF
jgi:small subunit ribosomal protein S30e